MKAKFTLFALLAVALFSCQRIEQIQNQTVNDDKSITFSSYNQSTKASVATITTLKANGFGVWGSENQPDGDTPTTWDPTADHYFFDAAPQPEEVQYSVAEGGWVYDPVKYWSDDDKVTMNFIAFSPYDVDMTFTEAASSSDPVYIGKFVINETIADQKDYLMATKFDLPQVQKVILEFQHVLSRIGFSAYAPSLQSNQKMFIETIQLRAITDEGLQSTPTPFFYKNGRIKIKNESSTSAGSYIRNPKWETVGDEKLAFTLGQSDLVNNGEITSAPARLNNEDKYIMVIPQSNMSGMEIYVKYGTQTYDGENWSEPEYKEKEFSCPITSFDLNTAYTFNFKLGVSEVAFDCLVTDWEEKVYSLNASGEVYAQSSSDDCNVYVDAQRKVVSGETVTDYTLYAETKTVVEDSDTTRMLPIWKIVSKTNSFEGQDVGDLSNIYLDYYTGLTLEEVTIGNSLYTALSFQINKETKDLLATTYYAEYVEDPISAYMVVDGNKLSNSVTVSRTYAKTGQPYGSKWKYYPYDCTVTLTPTGSHTGSPYVKWQVSTDGGKAWSDLDFTDESRNYSVGLGAALSFIEDKVYPEDDYLSNSYVYRAVYGTTSSDIVLYYYNDDKLHSSPVLTNYKDKDDGIAYPVGTQMRFAYPNGSNDNDVVFRLCSGPDNLENYSVIKSAGIYTIAQNTDKDSTILTFSLAASHSGKVIQALYEEPAAQATWYIPNKTTSGADFLVGSGEGYNYTTSFANSTLTLNFNDYTQWEGLGTTKYLLYYNDSNKQWVKTDDASLTTTYSYEGKLAEISITLPDTKEYEFIMQDDKLDDNKFVCFFDLSSSKSTIENMGYQLYDTNKSGWDGTWKSFGTSHTDRPLIVSNELKYGIKINCNAFGTATPAETIQGLTLNGGDNLISGTPAAEIIIGQDNYNTVQGGTVYKVALTAASSE